VSDGLFAITAPVAVYYVNDALAAAGDWTTSAGDDAQDGLSPATPKSSIQAILLAYQLNVGDVICVDAGSYVLTTNIVLSAAASGIKIQGYYDAAFPDRQAVLNRGNTASGSYVFELAGATDLTLDHLGITGATYGIYGSSSAASTGLTVSHCELYGNSYSGIGLEQGNDDAVITDNRVHDNGFSGYSAGNQAGIAVSALRGLVSGNTVYANRIGIYGNISYNTAAADQAILRNNTVFGNTGTGIEAAYATVLGNTVYGHTGSGYLQAAIYASGCTTTGNMVYDNAVGLIVAGGTAANNRVYHNGVVGIRTGGSSSARVEGNVVYSNALGIDVDPNGSSYVSTVTNNLLYANTEGGIRIQHTWNGVLLTGNTVYQVVGDAVRVQNSSRNVSLRNNILWVEAGYCVYVAADCQIGFASDYNDLYATGTGKLGGWAGFDFASRTDWSYELGFDGHSLSADPAFADPAGADDVLGFSDTALGAAQIIDNNDSGFSVTGEWSSISGGLGGTAVRHTASTSSTDIASWTFSGLTPGVTYQVALTWPAIYGSAYNARCRIFDGGQVVASGLISQGNAPAGFSDQETAWQVVANVQATGTTLVVQLDARTTDGYGPVLADAARLQPIAGQVGFDDNFHVPSGSPTIDAGDPNSACLAEPTPNGGRVNLGADGNTPQATTSSSQTVQVLAPNGLEKLQAGKPTTICWHTDGLTSIRAVALINVGGSATANWLANAYQTAGDSEGDSFTDAIDTSLVSDPAPQAVYQSYMQADYGVGKALAYDLPVPDGSYTVRLHFAEQYQYSVGNRVFDVYLQDTLLQADYDIIAAAGVGRKATTLSFTMTASGGSGLAIKLVNKTSSPALLSGIEVTAVNPAGVASPTVALQLSTDSGVNWNSLATGLTMDRFGYGSYSWTPTAATLGATALIRAVASDGSQPQDVSDSAFLIANGGHDYYVNDGSTADDVFTTAVGNNAYSGQSPDQPMASLAALLAAYTFGPGDVIHVDTGGYTLLQNLVLGASLSGVTIEGPASTSATFDRGSTATGSYVFELAGATDLTLDHLGITGATYGIYGSSSAASTGLTVSNCEIFGNSDSGIDLEQGNDDAVIADNRVHDNGSSSYDAGIVIYAMRGLVSGNTVCANRIGIYGSSPYNAAAADQTILRNNTVFGNTDSGIVVGNQQILDNTVYGHTGSGYMQAAIYASNSTTAGNMVYDNAVGLIVVGGRTANNRVCHNSVVGIRNNGSSSARVEDNVVYSNALGIDVDPDGSSYVSTVANNLLYANTEGGIRIQRVWGGALVTGNTVHQLVGDAVRVQNSTRSVSLRNNILWVEAGHCVYVAADCQTGFTSDYNLLHQGVDPNAHAAFWNGAACDTLADWRSAAAQDAHSGDGDPQFVDIDGADNVLGYSTAETGYDGGQDDNFYLTAHSTAIDCGSSWDGLATDLAGNRRFDDPDTSNTGSSDYDEVTATAVVFGTPDVGTAQGWRADDAAWTFALPFSFPFYGVLYSTVQVSSNGLLQFAGSDSASSALNTTAGLTANCRIAPLWDDLRTDASGDDIFVDTSIADQVTIRWDATNKADDGDVNFAVVLYADGRVQFEYGEGNLNLSPTIGLGRGDGETVRLSANDGQAHLENASPLAFVLQPGIVDLGAFEFRSASGDDTPPTVTATLPAVIDAQGTTDIRPTQIALLFSEELNTVDATAPTNYELRQSTNTIFGDADDVEYTLTASYVFDSSSGTSTVWLDPGLDGAALPEGFYQLTVRGGTTSTLHDVAGNRLDGDGDGVAGADYVRTFSIDQNSVPLLTAVPTAATIPELQPYTFDADAADADLPAQPLTFSLLGGPSGATIDATTGVFLWTPTEAQGPGDYTFTVRVSDGLANTDQLVTLQVTEVSEGSLDIDGNGAADALTDGILILRYLFDPLGVWNYSDALGSDAARTTRASLRTYLDGVRSTVLDVDGNGTADALTDGILILRYLFDPLGAWNYSDALGSDAARNTREAIRTYLNQYLPASTSSGVGLLAQASVSTVDFATAGDEPCVKESADGEALNAYARTSDSDAQDNHAARITPAALNASPDPFNPPPTAAPLPAASSPSIADGGIADPASAGLLVETGVPLAVQPSGVTSLHGHGGRHALDAAGGNRGPADGGANLRTLDAAFREWETEASFAANVAASPARLAGLTLAGDRPAWAEVLDDPWLEWCLPPVGQKRVGRLPRG
jgi:hypothetical protein